MSDVYERLEEALRDVYPLRGELGSGGMATVYLAEDAKHRRQVAVKVLHPELAASIGADRFLREIEIAARLNHPHILPLHDSGEADGLLYYVMPFVEGESLNARMLRERQMPLEDAIRIACEVADGLAYAHDQGVVHRDIKPGNVLLSGGHAVIADFGIARALSAAGSEQLTMTGIAVGTPIYMSPEQASGDAELDGRADIYALACVLYEMLAGMPPFSGPTPQALMARHAIDPVPSVRTVRANVPAATESAIRRALEKAPADRFRTGREFAEALRGGPVKDSTESTPIVTAEPIDLNAIAVLPFANMSADRDAEYFSDGMTEEIINALTRVPGVHVAARTSAFALKGQNVDVKEIGRRLKVSRVIEGSVRQAGNKLRISATLINVADGYHLWSERYDRTMTDVFEIQDELSGAIVEALKVTIAPSRPSATFGKRGTEDHEAFHLYLKGRHAWNRRALAEAAGHFGAAVARDSNYAIAHAGLADTFSILGSYGYVPPLQAWEKARAAATRAIEIDDRLPDGHVSVGLMEQQAGWDFARAEREFRRAIQLDPRHALAHGFLAIQLGAFGRADEAAAEATQAQDLEPLAPVIHYLAGLTHFWLRDYERAVDACQLALDVEEHFGAALWCMGAALSGLSRHDEALAAHDRIPEALQSSPWVMMCRGEILVRAGRPDDARSLLTQMDAMQGKAYVPAIARGWIHAHLGEADRGFEFLEIAAREHSPQFAWIAFWPLLEHVSGDDRYAKLLQSAGLEALVAS